MDGPRYSRFYEKSKELRCHGMPVQKWTAQKMEKNNSVKVDELELTWMVTGMKMNGIGPNCLSTFNSEPVRSWTSFVLDNRKKALLR